MNKALRDELMRLSPVERLDLVEELWDSIEETDLPPLSDDQIAEVERRFAEHERNPSSAIPWEDVRAGLWARLK